MSASPSGPHPADRILLLGPQRREPSVRQALTDLAGLGVGSRIAVVSAGWEEREAELLPFRRHVDTPVEDLEVFQRVEQIYRRDPELNAMVRSRHDAMRGLQRTYRERLAPYLQAARACFGTRQAAAEFGTRRSRPAAAHDDSLAIEERRHATRAVRQLDALHTRRIRELDRKSRPLPALRERPMVREQRRQVAERLAQCDVLCIAGGHVGILLSRLQLLGVTEMHRALPGPRPIIAWSAGAMALTEHVVLFHDAPPQGPGDPEVFQPGIGLAPGVVALPDASRRLALDDRARVALFAARFAPHQCVVLDPGARFDLLAGTSTWQAAPGSKVLRSSGDVAEPTA